MRLLKKIKAVVVLVFQHVERKHLPLVAAGVAYYFQMSLFPALVLLTAVVAYLPLQNAMQGATSFLSNVMPSQGVAVVEHLLSTITPHRGGLLSIGIITTLWLTSKAVKGVISGLDIMYDVRVPRSLWINRVLAFFLTFAVGLLLLLGVVLTLAGPTVERWLAIVVPVQSLWVTTWPYVQWSLSALFTFAAIEMLYLLAPNLPAKQRLTVPGAVIAAAILLTLSWGLGFYFHHFGALKLDLLYGILATPIALLIWLYWCATAILFGAQINVTIKSYKRLKESTPERAEQQRDAA